MVRHQKHQIKALNLLNSLIDFQNSMASTFSRRDAGPYLMTIVAYDGLFNLKVAGVWSIEIKGATTTGELVPLATTLNVVQSATPETTIPTETTVGG